MGDNGGGTYNNINAGSGYNEWNDTNQNYGLGGFAMWWIDGVKDRDGQNVGLMMTSPDPGIESSPYYDMAASGDIIDGTYPLIPTYVGHYFGSNNVFNSFRGRIPDVFYTAGSPRLYGQTTGYGLGGLSIPASGTIEYSVVADMFFPFSASLQPGG